jgi:hypothetical protein
MNTVGPAGARVPPVILVFLELLSMNSLTRPNRSDDADHRASASPQFGCPLRTLLLSRGRRVILWPALDEFGHRGNSGRTHSRGA